MIQEYIGLSAMKKTLPKRFCSSGFVSAEIRFGLEGWPFLALFSKISFATGGASIGFEK